MNYEYERNPGRCSGECHHVAITDDLIFKAQEDARKMTKKMKGYATHENRIWNEREDEIGSLAQTGTIEYIRSLVGLEDAITDDGYYNEDSWGDQCDFIHRGQRVDVKGSPLFGDTGVVYPGSRFLISHHQQPKEVDHYLFVKVDQASQVLHLSGMMSYHKFWDLNQIFQSPRMKSPCNFVYARQLEPIRKWLYGV